MSTTNHHARLRSRRNLAALTFAAAAGLAASPAHATSYTYIGASGGNWSTAANWNPNSAAPFVGDTALFHTNSPTPFTLNYDYNISGNGLASLNIDPFGPGNLIFSQSGGGTILIAASEVVGDHADGSAFGVYSHSGGLNAPGTLTVGLSSGANGMYNLSSSGNVSVSGNLYLGSNTGSVGFFNQTAGSLTVAGLATIGNVGTGTFNQTNGTSTFNGGLTIGNGGTGTFNQNGGGVSLSNTSTVNIGTTASGVGTYNLQSGTLVANVFNVGAGGLGFYSQSNGTAVFNQFVLCANVGTGAGTATISGGTFTTGLLDVSEQYGSSTFTQLNGTVNVTGSLILTINGTKGTYTLLGGTANFTSSNTNAISIGLGGGNATFSQLGGVSNFNSGWTADGFGSNLGSVLLNPGAIMNASNSLIIGSSGPALFTLFGGTTKVTAGGVYVGYQSGGNGTMNILGGTLNTPTLRIGYKGTGSVTQISGSVTVSGGLNLATFASTSGAYNLIGGTLAASSFFLGSDNGSAGVFNHSGGTATFSSSAVIGGLSGSGTGTYSLSNGATVTFNGNVTLGNTGSGTFNQTGGSSAFNNGLSIANGAGNGIVNLTGGTLNASTITLNTNGQFHLTTGNSPNILSYTTFNQNGGTAATTDQEFVPASGTYNQLGGVHTSPYLALGYHVGWTGTYNLSNGASLNVSGGNGNESIGGAGTGTFNQFSGSNSAANALYLGEAAASFGTYNHSGGIVTVGTGGIFLGYQGVGIYNLSGSGALTATGPTLLGNVPTASGTFNQTNGVSTFNGGLTVAGGGTGIVNLTGGRLSASTITLNNLGRFNLTTGAGVTNTLSYTTFNQTGGTMAANFEYVPPSGTYNQSGGVHTSSFLGVGYNLGWTGTYSLSNGASLTVSGFTGNETIGGSGTGVFNLYSGSDSVGNGLYLGESIGGFGTYNHSGGIVTVSSGGLTVGVSGGGIYNLSGSGALTVTGPAVLGSLSTGTGTFNQSNGASTFNGGLTVGGGSGGTGVVNLAGGTLSATTITLNPGGQFNLVSTATNALSYTAFNQTGGTFTASGHEYLPSGAIYTQSGGVHSASSGGLYIAPTPGGSGTYTLSIGTLTANRIGIGSDDTGTGGAGVFNQNGGTVNVTDGFFGLALAGQNSGSTAYNLTLGTLNVNAIETIGGQNSPGTFNQFGGTHSLSGQLQNLNLGTFNLSGGTFTAGSIQLNTGSTFNYTGGTLKSAGGVTQNGGTFSGTGSVGLYVDSVKGVASYTLNGGQLTMTNFEDIGSGAGGVGVFTQNGGTNSETSSITYIGVSSGVGTYNLQNGSFSPSQLELGANGGTGTLNQAGGTLTASVFIQEGNAGLGTLNQSGGTFKVTGLFHLGNTNGTAVDIFNVSGGTLTGNSGISLLGGDNGTNHTAINLTSSGVITTPFITTTDWNRVHLYGGTLNLTTGTSSNPGQLLVGGSGGNVTLNQTNSGGVVTLTNNIAVGFDGTGTYNLGTGATLSTTTDEYIGIGGAHVGIGAFNQTGGTHTVSNRIFMGYNSTDSGAFAISGGTLSVGALGGLALVVGNSGTGVFNQTGGTVTVSAELDLARNSGAHGTYNLNGSGNLTVNGVAILGNVSTASGTFNQTNGTSTFNAGLTIGGGGTGSVNLTGGTMSASAINLSSSGQLAISGNAVLNTASITTPDWSQVTFNGGTLNLTGGVSSNGGTLNIGNSTALATLNLNAGRLYAQSETVGNTGNAAFNQAGGSTNTVGDGLVVGFHGTGSYSLTNGTLAIAGNNFSDTTIGLFSTGTFNQLGGATILSSGTLLIGYGANGTYSMTNGTLTLTAGDEYLGYLSGGTGTFNQSSGTHTISAGSLTLANAGGSTGNYNLGGGTLTVPSVNVGGSGTSNGGVGTLNISGGTLTASAGIHVYSSSVGTNVSGITLSAGSLFAAATVNDGVIRQSGGISILGVLSGTGSVSLGGGTALTTATVTRFSQGALAIANNAKLLVTPFTPRFTNSVNTLTLTGNGTLDLANHALLVDAAATPLATIKAYITSARGTNGLWAGPGITSSSVAADPQHLGIGYANGTSGVSAGGVAGKIYVRPALIGDANLNGAADNGDISQIIARGHYLDGTSNNTWVDGDFNLDGQVTNGDISLLLASGNYLSGTTFSNAPAPSTARSAAAATLSGSRAPVTVVGLVGDGIPDYTYNAATGDVTFKRDGLAAANQVGEVHIRSASGKLDPNQLPDFSVGSNGLDVLRPTEIDLFRLSVTGKLVEFPDNYDFGNILPANLSAATLLTDLTLTYTIKGVSPDNLPSGLAIPEPTTLALLALSTTTLLSRRRRKTT